MKKLIFTILLVLILSNSILVLAQTNAIEDEIEEYAFDNKNDSEPTNYINALWGVAQRGIAKVRWATESEENIHYFSVERSDNNGQFKEVKKVIAQNKCYKTDYVFDDPKLMKDSAIYRVYQIDFEGVKSRYHQELKLKGIKTTDLTIHTVKENTKKENATVIFSAHKKGKLDFFLYNIIGRPLQKETWLVSTGANYKNFKLNDIPDGIYMVLIRQGDRSFVERFIKGKTKSQHIHP